MVSNQWMGQQVKGKLQSARVSPRATRPSPLTYGPTSLLLSEVLSASLSFSFLNAMSRQFSWLFHVRIKVNIYRRICPALSFAKKLCPHPDPSLVIDPGVLTTLVTMGPSPSASTDRLRRGGLPEVMPEVEQFSRYLRPKVTR